MKRPGKHVKVEVGAGDVVSIALPTFMVRVSRAAAATLRDRLNAVLPERITDLMHDPRVGDLDVLEAAKALLDERHQDTENLAYTIDHIKASRNPKGCTLCNCKATDERFGFPVCGYHVDHTEDDAPCPQCVPFWYWSDQNGNHWCHDCVQHPDDSEGLERRNPQAGDEWWCHECAAVLPATAAEEAAEDGRQILREVRDTSGPRPATKPAYHLLSIHGDVEPELHEYATEAERLEAAQDYRRAHGDEDGLFRVDVTADGRVAVDPFSGAELEADERRLCPACEAWADGGRTLTDEQWRAADADLCVPCRVAGPTKGMR